MNRSRAMSPWRTFWGQNAVVAFVMMAGGVHGQQIPRLPMGMNLGSPAGIERPFVDLMWTASPWITYHDGGGWNTGVRDSLEIDENGYPLELPQTINGEQTKVRFRINSSNEGRYVFLYDGEGEFDFRGITHEYSGGKHYITFDESTASTFFVNIDRSTRGNHVRNIRILPVDVEDTYDPAYPFTGEYLDFLWPFQVIRFQNWLQINNNEFTGVHWSERISPSWYTQRETAIELCIRLCNQLDADMWFQVPHAAWDDWIAGAAQLVRDSLKPCLKVYLEYSNELWNWAAPYPQSKWVGSNGRDPSAPREYDAHDSVYQALQDIGQRYCDDPENYCHPEKDAYMMARVFNIWRPIFEETGQRERLVCVAAIQDYNHGPTNRILRFLFNEDGGGCDALSPDCYFNLSPEARRAFDAMPAGSVTKKMLYDSARVKLERTFAGPGSDSWKLDSIADAFGVSLVCYEGGSHMYDYETHHWTDTLTALGSDTLMYDLYRRNIGYWHDTMGCGLITAYCTIGEDFLKFNHITDYSQIYLPRDQMMREAPKHLALLDAAAPKRECTVSAIDAALSAQMTSRGTCRLVGKVVSVTAPADGALTVTLCSALGRQVAVLYHGEIRANRTMAVHVPAEVLAAGVYVVKVSHASVQATMRTVVTR